MAKTLSDVEVKKQVEMLDDLEDTLEGKHFNYRWLMTIPTALVAMTCAYYFVRRWRNGTHQ